MSETETPYQVACANYAAALEQIATLRAEVKRLGEQLKEGTLPRVEEVQLIYANGKLTSQLSTLRTALEDISRYCDIRGADKTALHYVNHIGGTCKQALAAIKQEGKG